MTTWGSEGKKKQLTIRLRLKRKILRSSRIYTLRKLRSFQKEKKEKKSWVFYLHDDKIFIHSNISSVYWESWSYV